MTWLFESHNTIFTVAFVIMICFAVLEMISMICGLGISDWLQDLLPGGDTHAADVGADVHAHAEANADFDGHGGALQSFLSWLEIGKLPLLVSLNIFFASFSITGFLIQGLAVLGFNGHPLPTWIAASAAFVLSLPLLRMGNKVFGKFWPQDETTAVHQKDFIGCHGVITTGKATMDRAAEVKFTGPHGDVHYVMAFAAREPLEQSTPVILTDLHPDKIAHYMMIRNPHPLELKHAV